MLIICMGMKRSGSTWQYNVVRNIVEAHELGGAEGFFHEDELLSRRKELLEWARQDSVHVVKTHGRFESNEEPGTRGGIRIVFSYRDLRDMAASMKRQFGVEGGRLIHLVGEGVETYGWVRSRSDVLMQRYEDFSRDPCSAIREIADFLGYELDEELVARIMRACSRETMKKISDEQSKDSIKSLYHWLWHMNRRFNVKKRLLGAGFPESLWIRMRRLAAPYDERTLLRPGHLSVDGGSERRGIPTLDEEERRQIESLFSEWLAQEGYELPGDGGGAGQRRFQHK